MGFCPLGIFSYMGFFPDGILSSGIFSSLDFFLHGILSSWDFFLKPMHGVGWTIRTPIVDGYNLNPIHISERISNLRIPLKNGEKMTLISAYVPTLTSPDDIKEEFYRSLDRVIADVPENDRLSLMGDFNASTDSDRHLWPGVIGTEWVGKCNDNGFKLLSLWAEHELSLTNTVFQLPNKLEGTWRHPRAKHWHVLD